MLGTCLYYSVGMVRCSDIGGYEELFKVWFTQKAYILHNTCSVYYPPHSLNQHRYHCHVAHFYLHGYYLGLRVTGGVYLAEVTFFKLACTPPINQHVGQAKGRLTLGAKFETL